MTSRNKSMRTRWRTRSCPYCGVFASRMHSGYEQASDCICMRDDALNLFVRVQIKEPNQVVFSPRDYQPLVLAHNRLVYLLKVQILGLIMRKVDHTLLLASGRIKNGQDWLLIRDDEVAGGILISYPGATRGHQVGAGHREEVVLSETAEEALLGLLVREVMRGQEVI